MITGAKHYRNKLEEAVASRAETIGLARGSTGFYQYVGYLSVENDDHSKKLFLITVRDENGVMGNFITKSENVVKQLDEIIETVGDTDRRLWAIGFSEQKTKKGNTVLIVNMTMKDGAENQAQAEPAADQAAE